MKWFPYGLARFWNFYEAEIDKCSDMAAVTKFAYLKDLLEPKVRAKIDGLPFSSEGYERAKNIPRNKYGETSEIVNAYVRSIMGLPVISGVNQAFPFNVQALETLGKLKEVNGYVRMSIDNYPRSEGTWSEQTKTGKNGTFRNSFTPSKDGRK